MSVLDIILIIIGVIVVFGVIPTFLMSHIIYRELFIRKNPDIKERHCSFPEDEEYVNMYNVGLVWEKENKEYKKEVAIKNEGLNLFGEYFDFGNKTAVIIIPGRTEDCTYSYYFADTFKKAGCNVLCIDNRSHGLSDGKYNCVGAREYKDIHVWTKMLVDEFKNDNVILFGICIGASTAMNAITSKDCPTNIIAIITEGMFTTFKDSFVEHMKEGKHPMFPFTIEVMAWIRISSHANVVTDGPIKRIKLLEKPILMLHSKEDMYSLPKQGEKLYKNCHSKKKMVWFDKGSHSRIRPNNQEKFDQVIYDFIKEIG